MIKKSFFLFVSTFFIFSVLSAQQPDYKNPQLSSSDRAADLIKRMTVAEKAGQLQCLLGWGMYIKSGDEVAYSPEFEELVKNRHIGMLWGTFRADPWTQKTLINGLNPELSAKAANALQRYVMENSRLGIPVFLAEEAPHGHMAIGTTVFPTGIGQASTWNPALIEQMAAAISAEVRVQGGHISYGPVIDLSRDPRWSRVEESFGEDPVLTTKIAAAVARGHGGGKLNEEFSTISTLKHLVAYGIPEGGHNGASAHVGERELQEVFLPPFKAAIDAGALSVMTAYNSIDGVPCTSNKNLLTGILRDDWGFNGFVVSDLYSIDGLMGSHRVAANLRDAASLALDAGVDVDLGGNAYARLEEALDSGRIDMTAIDDAVHRVLKLKFDMGLFENPYADPQKAKEIVKNREHIALARRVAQESVVLLKNRADLLPLSRDLKIAVIGPNADTPYNQLGDYTAPQDEKSVVTILDGIRSKLGESSVEYVKGCAIRDTADVSIREAVEAANRADVVVVAVGGSSARDFKTEYIETGAAVTSLEAVSDMESGEGFDRASLNLLGKQSQLLEALKKTDKPIVVIYIQGRPLNMNWADENADALLTAWYPGEQGGNAIADVLFGDYNPAGRLPISVPQHEGQLPVYYNKKNPRSGNYVEMTSKPLYAFGYGLSYTEFEYSGLEINQLLADSFDVSFNLKNIGDRDGDEVVQLYLRHGVSSVVQPVLQLKDFSRIHLNAGAERRITFRINESDLSIIDKNMKRVVEPGTFTVMIGSSSDKIELTGQIIQSR